MGPWFNGYQCGMQISQSGFNSQRVPDHRYADIGQVG